MGALDSNAMDSPKLDLKVFARAANGSGVFDHQLLIPVFHRWIQEQQLDELMIDVADYSHVPDGPSVLLVCHDAHYGLDYGGGELGLLYSRRRETRAPASSVASLGERLRSVFRSALTACSLLEREPTLVDRLSFPGDRFRLVINDRRYGAEAIAVVAAELRTLLAEIFPVVSAEIEIAEDSDDRPTLRIRVPEALGCATLLDRIEGAGG